MQRVSLREEALNRLDALLSQSSSSCLAARCCQLSHYSKAARKAASSIGITGCFIYIRDQIKHTM
jgi:hypothetical protein